MKTKKKSKYKTKAGSFAKEIEDPIQRATGEINLQELLDIIMAEQFMENIQQLDPLFTRQEQLNEENEENQNRGRLFRQRENEEDLQFNRNVRLISAGKKRKPKKRKNKTRS